MQRVNDRGEIKIKMCNWRQTSLIILPAKFWNYRDLALTEKFQFSTNAIESLNRSVKYFLGMGFLDINKLDAEMNRFHSQKLIEATDGLEKGRLNSKRRQTILRENNIFDILKKFQSLTQSEKLASLQFHLLQIGTLSKKISVRNISIACRHLPKLKLSKLNHRHV